MEDAQVENVEKQDTEKQTNDAECVNSSSLPLQANDDADDTNPHDETDIENTSNEANYSSMKAMYDAQPVTNSLYANAEVNVDPAIVASLTEGFVQRFLPSLESARKTIHQINSSQTVLIETIQQEVTKFDECREIAQLEQTMSKAKLYHNKLLKVRREMTLLHEKSAKLKKRSLKLQQQKQKEELTRAHDLEREMEKERMLTAKVATTPD